MINLCKITLYLLIIFLIYSPWIVIMKSLLGDKSIFVFLIMCVYLLLFISLSYLVIRCGHWIIFETNIVEEVLNGT